ncbi:MAG TPA: VOC family protein [Polyangiaceae bacterium]|nr:VOC family protein [Polyangiaceae bacterium]
MARREYVGRLIDHLHLVVADIDKSRRFYRAVLGSIGRELNHDAADSFACDELYVSNDAGALGYSTAPHRIHLAFQATSREQVDEFHRRALDAGGRDNGPPGIRRYHPSYYAAFVFDPDGNNVEVVHHGRVQRSAEVITLDIEGAKPSGG